MNTMMYEHPFTSKQISVLSDLGMIVLETVEKVLVCGDRGKGAMASIETIVETVERAAKCILDSRCILGTASEGV